MERICKDDFKIMSIDFASFFFEEDAEIPMEDGIETISKCGGKYDYKRENSL